MSLTPQDIQAKQFHVRFRGFDVEEVDGFLEQIAENFLMVIEENKAIKLQADTCRQELDKLKKEEHSFKNALISAQNISDQMVRKSREEADYILSQAHEEVKRLKDEALKEITELEYRVDQLRGTQGELENDLRAVIDDYLDMIDNSSSTRIGGDNAHDDTDEREMSISSELYGESDDQLTTSSALTVDSEDTGMAASTALSDADVDLSDLYEKIELPSAHPADHDIPEAENDSDDDEVTVQFESETSLIDMNIAEGSIPDLDDEIMFTLEDPLDEVKIEEDKS
nr:DivIVA domain-containing protein [Desulfobulbaceae bacterium]